MNDEARQSGALRATRWDGRVMGRRGHRFKMYGKPKPKMNILGWGFLSIFGCKKVGCTMHSSLQFSMHCAPNLLATEALSGTYCLFWSGTWERFPEPPPPPTQITEKLARPASHPPLPSECEQKAHAGHTNLPSVSKIQHHHTRKLSMNTLPFCSHSKPTPRRRVSLGDQFEKEGKCNTAKKNC